MRGTVSVQMHFLCSKMKSAGERKGEGKVTALVETFCYRIDPNVFFLTISVMTALVAQTQG